MSKNSWYLWFEGRVVLETPVRGWCLRRGQHYGLCFLHCDRVFCSEGFHSHGSLEGCSLFLLLSLFSEIMSDTLQPMLVWSLQKFFWLSVPSAKITDLHHYAWLCAENLVLGSSEPILFPSLATSHFNDSAFQSVFSIISWYQFTF